MFAWRMSALKEIKKFYFAKKGKGQNACIKVLRKLSEDAQKNEVLYDTEWITSFLLEFQRDQKEGLK